LKATVKLLSQKVNNTRTEHEVFQANSREFIHEKAIELESRQKNYEDKVQIEIDQRLEEYENQMEKFAVGLKELKEIRNLIDPTIEEEIERIRKVYELKLENIVDKMERISRKAVENGKSLDEILGKYQVEIEAMKDDFSHTTEIQNKRIQAAFDEQNDVLKAFDSDLNTLERKFKVFQNEQVTQTDDILKNTNEMIMETRKTIDKHNEKINSQFSEYEVSQNRRDIEFDAKLFEFNQVVDRLTKDNIKNEKFKSGVKEQIDKVDEKYDVLEKEIKEIVGVVKILDGERIRDGRVTDELTAKIKALQQDVKM
jgi:chromosome segregation ATPase